MDEVKSLWDEVSNERPHELQHGSWIKNLVDFHSSFIAKENQFFVQWILLHLLNLVYW